MRKLIISAIVVLATMAAATASDRYPAQKRYVNQSGQVIAIGNVPQIAAYAEVPVSIALPPVQIVPVVAAPRIVTTAPQLASTDNTDWPGDRSNR